MDVRYNHGSLIHCIRASHSQDAPDLLAIGGEHSVAVLRVLDTAVTQIATFNVGCRITAIAWSSRTVSPSLSDDWSIELAVATANFGLHLLSKSAPGSAEIFPFGGGLSGHHGKVTGMSFSGGSDQDSSRYVATVSDDKMLMVWDLETRTGGVSPSAGSDRAEYHSFLDRPQPTAYPIPFPHPLTSVGSHPLSSKEFLVSDNHGSIFLTDWRSDPEGDPRNLNVVELVEPRALSDAVSGIGSAGAAAWRADNPDIIGATYGSRYSIWDLSNLHGGKPNISGPGFPEGGHQFRWCPTFSEYFALSTNSPSKGAVIHVHNTSYINAQPTVFTLAPRPLQVRDFDFLAASGIPRIAAAVGNEAVIFYIGIES